MHVKMKMNDKETDVQEDPSYTAEMLNVPLPDVEDWPTRI